jgi:hypothetical protein
MAITFGKKNPVASFIDGPSVSERLIQRELDILAPIT